MKERPILFKGEMVRAVLDGRKTQTRRVVKVQPEEIGGDIRFPWATFYNGGNVHTWDRDGVGGENWNVGRFPKENKFIEALKRTPYTNACPYGQTGDRLWVRETWAKVINGEECIDPPRNCKGEICEGCHVEYRADTEDPYPGEWPADEVCDETPRWRPSIHMPRWASRINLEVKAIRVERVQEISNKDAKAEGISFYDCSIVTESGGHEEESPSCVFASLWDSINAKRGYSWESNPWVWVVEFKLLEAKCN